MSIRSITSIQPNWKWWATPLIVAVGLLDAMLPLFYFALYRFKGTLKFPKWSRTTALLVACALGAVFCVEALQFAQLRIFPTTSQYFSLFAELCCAVLLFQVGRAEFGANPTALPRSGPFFAITKAAGLWGGLWIAIGCFQVVATPFVYAAVRHIASGNGRPSPRFARHAGSEHREVRERAVSLGNALACLYDSETRKRESRIHSDRIGHDISP